MSDAALAESTSCEPVARPGVKMTRAGSPLETASANAPIDLKSTIG